MSAKPQRPLGRRLLAGFAGLVAVALLAGLGWLGYREVASQPVKRVVFAGELDRLPHVELEALTQAVIRAGAHGVDAAAVREAARRMPWVADAAVRRRWPDTVEISFTTHRALARWDDSRLVSPEGDVFPATEAAPLPRLRGPEGSAPAMARQYREIAARVAPLGRSIEELRLSARGGWLVVLDSGLTLQLGRGDVASRLERFVAAWPQVVRGDEEPRHADLRYPNGFAVRRAATVTVVPRNDRK